MFLFRLASPCLALVMCLSLYAGPASAGADAAESPQLLLADVARLAATRERVRSDDAGIKPAMDKLLELADEALAQPLVSVTDKNAVPPSGDMRDYVSLSPYWWPNPDTADGLPYIRKDGQVNPERDEFDTPRLQTFGNTVTWLGFAYYFTGDEKYAEAAVRHLRHFLLDPETRMNPRMPYAQNVPGVTDGRKYGIIETLRLRWVPDAITLMRGSEAMTPEVVAGLKNWFGEYAIWLNTSEMGLDERDGKNNHATWAKVQIALFSAFAGDLDTARSMVEMARDAIPQHFAADGSQPEEISRTTSLDYHEFNLQGYVYLAKLGERAGIDLWHYETNDGRGMRMAVDFLLPYLNGEEQWPHEQIKAPKEYRFAETMRRCALGYDDPAFEAVIDRLELRDPTEVYLNLILTLPADFPAAR